MTKKNKRIIILISVLFLFMFSLSVYQLYERIENQQVSYYYQISRSFDQIITSDNKKTSDDLISFVSRNHYELDNCAWGVALYNQSGEMIAKTGSFIRIYDFDKGQEEYIHIDKYLTSEIKKKIYDYFINTKYNSSLIYCSEFNYAEKNGKKIPVSIKIISPVEGYETLNVIFSNINDFKTLTANSNDISLDMGIIDLNEDSYIHKEFVEVNNYLDNFDKEKIKKIFSTSTGQGIDSFEGKESYGTVELADGFYAYAIRMIYNYRNETLRSNAFRSELISQILYYLIFYLIAVFAFIKYFKKNKKLEDAKFAFTSAAAHELKTPLAVIENQCECIMENVAPKKNDEYINSIYSESLRMNKLVATFLQYNRIASADKIKKTNCKLDDLVKEELDKYNSNLKIKNIVAETDIRKNATIKCNRDLISLVIDNYLSNAIKHTESGKKIKIKVAKEGSGYIFSVYNEGKRIPSEDGSMIFNALYKTDKARKRADNSTGMGLAICKEILDQHHYSYGFINKSDGVEFYFAT